MTDSSDRDADVVALAALPRGPVSRIAFLGTPDIAAHVLTRLIDAGFDIGIVVTRPDKRRGRGSDLIASDVKVVAAQHGVPVVHRIDDLVEEHRRHPFQLAVVVAYGSLIKRHVLELVPMVNLHVSLLPRWRGAAPIERAILAGDDTTGVCLMQLDEGLDTGGILASASMDIGPSTTADEIRARLAEEGSRLLIEGLRSGLPVPIPQAGTATHAPKIEPMERHVQWSESADMVARRVRIGNAWTTFRGRRLKIHRVTVTRETVPLGHVVIDTSATTERVLVGCADGSVQLVDVQPEGKQRMSALDWAHGARLRDGESMEST